ncbi:MAG: DMT family transporter [Rhizobiales bacterium]|nr:DMT family transporter [Hyphomicrobiales bacterium]
MALSSRHLAALAMLGAVTIYGTNFAISRHAVLNGLTPNDLTALRFAFSGLVLLPSLLRWGLTDCAGIGWGRGIVLTISSGLPMTLLMLNGLALAPAAHGAAIAPGTVTVVGAIGAYLLFGARLSGAAMAGIGVVLSGLFLIGLAGTTSGARNVVLGDLCFLGVGLIWGVYPLLLQHWRVDPLRATAVLAVFSMLIFGPWYLAFGNSQLLAVSIWVVIVHGVNQGILNVIVGLWLWGWAVKKVGAANAGRFPPLIPVIGTLSAIPLLGELPGLLQWMGIALIVTGLMISARK